MMRRNSIKTQYTNTCRYSSCTVRALSVGSGGLQLSWPAAAPDHALLTVGALRWLDPGSLSSSLSLYLRSVILHVATTRF